MNIKRRYRVKPHLWTCVECAKAGRPHILVPNREKVCPFGHSRKGR